MNRRFPDLPSGYPFPALELETLAAWRRGDVFRETLRRTADRPPFVFFEGPPTANNVPHVGHVVTRVVKDLIPRFRTMRGFHVARKAGWDTHGLAVEIEVEKRLGFSGKQQIEAYGIEAFNQACLDSVHTYEKQWRAMTERVGAWFDMDDPYYTYSNTYIESVWWALAELARKGLLAESYKIQPYCARCGTTLSSHEVAQNYKDAEDPSIWTLFRLRADQRAPTLAGATHDLGGAALVGWTTTPWTTLANAAVAVHPDLAYKLIENPRQSGELLIIGEDLGTPVPVVVEVDGKRQQLDLRSVPPLARFRGRDLEGLLYERLFRFLDPEIPGRVVLGDYVTASDGTGLVHTAPPFGEDDYQTGQRYDLPLWLTVDTEGKIVAGAGDFSGLWFKDADAKIIQDLKARGLMLHHDRYRHNYPFCWRCDRPLLYYATKNWFIKTTARRDELVALNKLIHWHPAHVGEGRFGNWLENVVDWALSRKRYWGTPLPVWRCDGCTALPIVIGSYVELFTRSGITMPTDVYDRKQFDPHRPHVDRISWTCPDCGGTIRRVEDVIDAWFDSGAMPFAQHHYPFENPELIDGGKQFPANFISEAVDQTRGWFYTLHAISTLLFGKVAYENCIVLGHVNDDTGRKMSKRLGNVVEPMQVIEESGADALRWYFCVNNPELPSRFSSQLVREAAQSFLIPLWNALSFFTIYANLDGWRPGRAPEAGASRPALDRWILLRLDQLVTVTTAHLDGYGIADAARELETFAEELTNWYIRRSRDRFWAAPTANPTEGGTAAGADAGGDAKESAYQALYEVLTTLARLLAPFVPFFADVVHGQLVRSQDGGEPSVHLESWPAVAERVDSERLVPAMAALQRIVRLGHAARNTHNLKTRQPLAAVTVIAADPALRGLVEPHAALLRDELNVQEIRWAEDRARYVRQEVHPIFPKLGPRFGKRMPEVKKALAAADGDALAGELEARGAVAVTLGGPSGERVELAADEVEVRLIEHEGTATQGDRELLVALDTTLTPELVSAGLAREIVHHLQAARKEANLAYADRIRVGCRVNAQLAAVLAQYRDAIAAETLATEIAVETVPTAAAAPAPGWTSAPIEGHDFSFMIARVSPPA